MTIKKCDRCKQEIASNKINILIQLSGCINEVIDTLTGKPKIRLIDKNTGNELDLCPYCIDSLQKWMKYGQKIGEIRETIPPDEKIRGNDCTQVVIDEIEVNKNDH